MPSWFLEPLFKRQLSITQQRGREVVETPFQFAEKSLVSLPPLLCVFFSDSKGFKASAVGVPSMVSESLKQTTKDYTEEEYLQAVKDSSASACVGEIDHSSTFLI